MLFIIPPFAWLGPCTYQVRVLIQWLAWAAGQGEERMGREEVVVLSCYAESPYSKAGWARQR